MPLPDIISRLESYGFAGIYINCDSYTDKGVGMIKSLQQLGFSEIIESEKKDLACVILKPSPNPVLPESLYPSP